MLTVEAAALLDEVEALEMRSLSWGYTDGALSEAEWQSLAAGSDAARSELIEAGAVIRLVDAADTVRYRSRFAELVRLLFRLRQLFPGKPWTGAPRLVSDFRVDRRARRYPQRNRVPAEIGADHAETIGATSLRRDVWRALTGELTGLATFQERATVRLLAAGGDTGTIVTAGTGSGKTLAFYLPALLRLAAAIDADRWVKAIAIYPRTELLKDQFAESYRMARRIDAALARHGKRKLTVGTYFGSTPYAATEAAVKSVWEERYRRGFVCPWLRCPACNGELVWRTADLARHFEQLRCLQPGCEHTIGADEIVLTRQRVLKEPPDILFTTTETLNQRLSDQWTRRLFGVGAASGRKPFMALLDEVHTYSGTSGAQAALVLRRWRHLLGAQVVWAGLSATLAEASRFFSELTGVPTERVEEITPFPEEFESEGAEYQLILRGDPGSRASLLSTTIQSAMLISRTLDPPGGGRSGGAYGERLFAFTDNLDVINRLFDDLRDAEAYDLFGKPKSNQEPLAALRGPGPDATVRDRDGQRWAMCERVGHTLTRPLIVGRTSSQDSGVLANANVIVATASLEVGFNDPAVGAVLQHKAPRNSASFLQRKGRAGRRRGMRPITATILSDYGRDRLAFQAYEHLFDPDLPPQHLPIANLYVLKMQAVFAMLDWLASRSSGGQRGNMWGLLGGPDQGENSPELRRAVAACLDALMRCDPTAIADLKRHLIGALRIDETAADTLLWDPPRSLILEAVPTLHRRLETGWTLAYPAEGRERDLQIDHHPLPDFIPRALFNDLNLPEVSVIVPPATVRHEERRESVPIIQALGQLVPGRVTRRFAHERGQLCHWVPVDISEAEQSLPIANYAEESEYLGAFTPRCNDPADRQALLVYRPWTVRLHKAGRQDALPSSNAVLSWCSELIANGEPLLVPVPRRSRWSVHVESVAFHIHRFSGSVTVRRFAPTADANVRRLDDDHQVTVRFTGEGDAPAALGFVLEVDGFYLDLSLPDAEALAQADLPDALNASARTAYLRHRFLSDPDLPPDLNAFQRDWLFQIALSAVSAEAAATGVSSSVAAAAIFSEERLVPTLGAAMVELLGAEPPALDEEDGQDDAGQTRLAAGRLGEALQAQLHRRIVRDRLAALIPEFETPDPTVFGAWLRRTLAETLGEAMLQACLATAPRHAAIDTLLLDFEDGPEGKVRIWITEATLGGAGVLEAFAERFASEPRLLFNALEAALAPTDLEQAADSLRLLLELLAGDAEIASAVADLRAVSGHAERAERWEALTHLLAERAVATGHAFAVSLNSRLLRPGSNQELDRLLRDLMLRWEELEGRLGLAIGLREFAFHCARDAGIAEAVRAFLRQQLPAAAIAQSDLIAVVTGLLWPRGGEIRQRVLQSYNPFRRARLTDPALVRALMLSGLATEVQIEAPDWRQQVADLLALNGTVRLSADRGAVGALHQALVELAATPVDVAYLHFYPTVERLERDGARLVAVLTLREQV